MLPPREALTFQQAERLRLAEPDIYEYRLPLVMRGGRWMPAGGNVVGLGFVHSPQLGARWVVVTPNERAFIERLLETEETDSPTVPH